MGAGGAAEFIKLKDTPASYSGSAKKALVVNDTEDAVLFDREMLPLDGTRMMTGDLDMNNHAIDGIDILRFYSFDAAIKAYADDIVELVNKAESSTISLRIAFLYSLTGIEVADGYMVETDEVRARDGDGLKLYEDGGVGIFVKDGGDVGIGTAAPGAKLDVNGDMKLDGQLDIVNTLRICNDYNCGGGSYPSYPFTTIDSNYWVMNSGPAGTGRVLTLNNGNNANVYLAMGGGDVGIGGTLDMNNHHILRAALDLANLDDQEYRGFVLSSQIAGESISFGNLVYHASDNRYNKADADTLSKTEGDLAIVLTTGTTAENGYVTILKLGTVKDTSWSFTIGAILYVSQTAGVITATEPSAVGTFSRKVGYAQAANVVFFNPSHTILENG